MAEEKKKKLCPDPDCNTENDAEAGECSKCSLDFDSFNALDRILSVRERITKKNTPAAPAQKKAGLGDLWGGKKK